MAQPEGRCHRTDDPACCLGDREWFWRDCWVLCSTSRSAWRVMSSHLAATLVGGLNPLQDAQN